MDRTIVYPGALPLAEDLLNTNKNAMVGLGYALQAILGTSTLLDGLACTPTTPASMMVNLATGSIYSLAAIDASPYSTLPADAADQTMKQGIALGTTNLACPAPTTAGYSTIYLVQAAFAEVDTGPAVLSFFNASNPSQPYSGPNGLGAASNTVRQGKCAIALKASASGTAPAIPVPDPGYTGLWVITVTNGQTAITSSSIAPFAGAPFVNTKLTGRLANVRIQFLTTSGTYTPTPGFVQGLFFLLGGGGGGGGSYTTTSMSSTCGGGGSAGGMAFGLLNAGQIGASQQLTIGAAGAGGAVNAAGSSGGTSSLGALASATGGNGGSFLGSNSGNATGGVVGGTAAGTTGILGIPGSQGGSGTTIYANSGAFYGLGGAGADTLFGAGGQAVSAGSPSAHAGYAATGYGAGGGGAVTTNYQASGLPGGPGAPGLLVAIEFCNQ